MTLNPQFRVQVHRNEVSARNLPCLGVLCCKPATHHIYPSLQQWSAYHRNAACEPVGKPPGSIGAIANGPGDRHGYEWNEPPKISTRCEFGGRRTCCGRQCRACFCINSWKY